MLSLFATSAAGVGSTILVFVAAGAGPVTSVVVDWFDAGGGSLGSTVCPFTVLSDVAFTVTLPASVPAGAVLTAVGGGPGPGGVLTATTSMDSGTWMLGLGSAGAWSTPAVQTDTVADSSISFEHDAWSNQGAWSTDVTDPADGGPASHELTPGGSIGPQGPSWAETFGNATDELTNLIGPFEFVADGTEWEGPYLAALLATDLTLVPRFPDYGAGEIVRFLDLHQVLVVLTEDWFPSDPTPAGAIGVEFDYADLTPAARLAGSVTMDFTVVGSARTDGQSGVTDTSTDWTIAYVPPGSWTGFDPTTGQPLVGTAVPGSALAGLVPVGSVTVTGAAPASYPVPTATLDMTQVGSFVSAFDWTGLDPGPGVTMVLYPAAMSSGVPPALPAWGGADPWGNFLSTVTPVSAHWLGAVWQVPWQPPRWRWVYGSVPYQRSFPRDDGLGASTRRSFPPIVDTPARSFPRLR